MMAKIAPPFLLCLIAFILAACGFHLRGHGDNKIPLAFQSVYIKAGSNTPFVEDLRNALAFNSVAVSASSAQATITLEIGAENSDKQILALSGTGRIREFQLRYRVSLRAYDSQQVTWLPEEEILLMRTLTFDDSQVLAKEQEEALLYKDMRADAVTQTLRRLSRAKPHAEK